ncbi:MAG: ABC transporter ATP-binding protein [Deltaproteobacteria bacterium]|jgi:multiple sugar transport system ATP-binding protein|nr:ABC transporter ATP-binding protein [Deltaproteobacteria bacterium]
MIELIDLTKEYPGATVTAVDKINLTIHEGETIALLGPSGCGKTSTLNMIVGLEKPTSGDIKVKGRSIIDVPIEKRGIGLVFQDYAVFTSMTVEGNLSFGLEMKNAPKDKIKQTVQKTAALLGLSDKLKLKASKLSGSELQRVAIGRTLAIEPSILLLDEPLSNLEAEARLAMRQELRRLRQELGLTIIYVTHDQVEALSLADRIAIMNFGRLIEVEKTSVIVENPADVLVAQFLGSPPMNVLKGYFHKIDGVLYFRQSGVDFRLSGARLPNEVEEGSKFFYFLGLKPEDLSLGPQGSDSHKSLIEAPISGLERRGYDSVLSFNVKGIELKCEVDSAQNPKLGSKKALFINPENIVIFNRSGRRMDKRLLIS